MIDSVVHVATEIGVTAAEVALAWLRGRKAVSSTLIGVRTIGHLRANLASLELTLTPEQVAALDAVSGPSLDFPATINDGPARMLGFGGTTIDGIQTPVWPMLLASAQRY